MKILLTGFDPFGGETVNPAFEAVKLLPDTIAGAEIVKQEVPTEFIRAGEVLEAAIQANQPDVVICIGQAGGRSAITPEKVAINLMDGRIADNAGYQPIDVTIQEDGETAYFTSLPVKAMVQNIKDAGIPSALSYTAGSYVFFMIRTTSQRALSPHICPMTSLSVLKLSRSTIAKVFTHPG